MDQTPEETFFSIISHLKKHFFLDGNNLFKFEFFTGRLRLTREVEEVLCADFDQWDIV